MSKESTFFERLLSYSQSKGVKNVSALSEALGYDKPEKLYRLKRDPSARPSFDVLAEITKLFEDLNLRWLLTGDGERELVESSQDLPNMVEEPQSVYITKSQAQRKLLKEKERLIKQQQETISALQEAYGLLKQRLEEVKK